MNHNSPAACKWVGRSGKTTLPDCNCVFSLLVNLYTALIFWMCTGKSMQDNQTDDGSWLQNQIDRRHEPSEMLSAPVDIVSLNFVI